MVPALLRVWAVGVPARVMAAPCPDPPALSANRMVPVLVMLDAVVVEPTWSPVPALPMPSMLPALVKFTAPWVDTPVPIPAPVVPRPCMSAPARFSMVAVPVAPSRRMPVAVNPWEKIPRELMMRLDEAARTPKVSSPPPNTVSRAKMSPLAVLVRSIRSEGASIPAPRVRTSVDIVPELVIVVTAPDAPLIRSAAENPPGVMPEARRSISPELVTVRAPPAASPTTFAPSSPSPRMVPALSSELAPAMVTSCGAPPPVIRPSGSIRNAVPDRRLMPFPNRLTSPSPPMTIRPSRMSMPEMSTRPRRVSVPAPVFSTVSKPLIWVRSTGPDAAPNRTVPSPGSANRRMSLPAPPSTTVPVPRISNRAPARSSIRSLSSPRSKESPTIAPETMTVSSPVPAERSPRKVPLVSKRSLR